MNAFDSKKKLRIKIRGALKRLPPQKRKSDSEKLCSKLEQETVFKTARAVLFFSPLPDEVDLWPLMEETICDKKIVALPCFDLEKQIYKSRRVKNLHVEILSGQFGIREPAENCVEIPLNDLDLVLVPGVAFDLRGNRLGRGKGFYDRLLKNFRGKKIGIAFEGQIVETVPSDENDARMDFILTPARFLEIAR